MLLLQLLLLLLLLLLSRPRCESHGQQPERNHYSPALHRDRDFFFVEESGSLTESQHTVSFTGCNMTGTTKQSSSAQRFLFR